MFMVIPNNYKPKTFSYNTVDSHIEGLGLFSTNKSQF